MGPPLQAHGKRLRLWIETNMKSISRRISDVVCLSLVGIALIGRAETYGAAPDVKLNVDWAEFLGNLDSVWPSPPTRPIDGPMIANGVLGTYLIQDEETSEIRFEMSRADMCDVRPGFRQRKTNGYFKLALTHGRPTGTCGLDLWNAQIKAD